MTTVNLIPHPMHIYPPGTPERIEPGSLATVCVIPSSPEHPPARLGHTVLGEEDLNIGVPVERVAFGPEDGQVSLPEPVGALGTSCPWSWVWPRRAGATCWYLTTMSGIWAARSWAPASSPAHTTPDPSRNNDTHTAGFG